MISKLAYVHPEARLGADVTVEPFACIAAAVVIGDGCWIGPGAVIRGDAAEIILEEEVAVEDGVIIHAGGADKRCLLSRRVTIGHGAIVHARYLGPEASIGMGAVLSLGCAIGAGSVVAESALVPQGQSVPPETLVSGIPAKPLRPLTQADRESWQATKDWYVRLTVAYLDPNHFFPVAPREA